MRASIIIFIVLFSFNAKCQKNCISPLQKKFYVSFFAGMNFNIHDDKIAKGVSKWLYNSNLTYEQNIKNDNFGFDVIYRFRNGKLFYNGLEVNTWGYYKSQEEAAVISRWMGKVVSYYTLEYHTQFGKILYENAAFSWSAAVGCIGGIATSVSGSFRKTHNLDEWQNVNEEYRSLVGLSLNTDVWYSLTRKVKLFIKPEYKWYVIGPEVFNYGFFVQHPEHQLGLKLGLIFG